MENEQQKAVAEYLRKTYKQLRWAANNIAAVYELLRPVDMPPIEDPNQLKLFNDDNVRTDECRDI